MKTTIELPDDLIKQVKMKSILEGRKLKDTVAELLRRGLAAPDEQARPERQSALTFDDRTGLPLIQCGHAARPADEITADRAADILLQQEAAWHRDAR